MAQEKTALAFLLLAIATSLQANPADEKALALKELSDAYEIELEEKNKQIEILNEGNAAFEKQLEALAALPKDVSGSAKETFEHDGKTYELLVSKANIPGIGIRTALEISFCDDSKAFLVNNDSGLIKEVK